MGGDEGAQVDVAMLLSQAVQEGGDAERARSYAVLEGPVMIGHDSHGWSSSRLLSRGHKLWAAVGHRMTAAGGWRRWDFLPTSGSRLDDWLLGRAPAVQHT